MKVKIPKIENQTIFYFLILIGISIFATLKAKWSYDSFIETNIPIYDGVIYEIQQLRRYELFNGDFSLINRYSQAYYEFHGHYVSALYNSFVTFCFPSFLINDNDIFLRSIISIFFFSLAIFMYFKDQINPKKLLFIIAVILQFPLFYDHQVGLGAYIPEFTCALLLISGYLFILYFFKNLNFKYYILGVVLMLLPIGIRFNFFAYIFLFCIPLFFIYFKKWKNFDKKMKIYTSVFTLLTLIITSCYILYFFKPFYKYYTETAYNYSYFSLAFSTMLNNMKNYFSWEGICVLILLIISNSAPKNENSKFQNLLISYPFIAFFSFIILYLQSENIPHINSAMSVFLILVSFIILPFKKIKFLTDKLVISILIILVISLNYSFIKNVKKERYSPLYSAQREVINFLSSKIKIEKNDSLKYLCFFEGMAEIPMNVVVYKNTGVMLTNDEYFYNHDIFYYNSLKCKTPNECFEHYLPRITNIDYIIINSTPPKINLYPIAKGLNIKMQKYLNENSKYKICKKINSSFYGEITFYKLIKEKEQRGQL